MNRVRITNDGLSTHTLKIKDEAGNDIPGVVTLALGPVGYGDKMTATVELLVGKIDVLAHPLLGLETLKASAEALGYRLEPVDAIDVSSLTDHIPRYIGLSGRNVAGTPD
jgi:hypothetical protein